MISQKCFIIAQRFRRGRLICHDHTLCDDFKAVLEEKLVSCIRNYQIYNLAIRYGKSNPHSSVGYYIHPRVTQLIVDWLTKGSPN